MDRAALDLEARRQEAWSPGDYALYLPYRNSQRRPAAATAK
jgi:hypothetical protein